MRPPGLSQLTIELEAAEVIGAGRYERSESRTANATVRARALTTKAGDVQLRSPSCARPRSCLPEMLAPRWQIDQALNAVVMEAYVYGVFTRSVDGLVAALGGSGVSKSEVSRICGGLDEGVQALRGRMRGDVSQAKPVPVALGTAASREGCDGPQVWQPWITGAAQRT